jgi:hypothetical protein
VPKSKRTKQREALARFKVRGPRLNEPKETYELYTARKETERAKLDKVAGRS